MESLCYPLTPPKRQRPKGREMQVLCLGLSRSGTDSLRAALEMLGYKDVYHGFVITAKQREDCAFWVPLMRQKYASNILQNGSETTSLAQEPDFDSVLGNCEAVTDGPANVFGEELVRYYPDAKVILNRRRDMQAWYASMQNTCIQVFSWPMWTLSWFDTSICWLWFNFHLVMQGYYNGDFNKHGQQVAKEHYQGLEKSLARQNRPYLDWSVEDGWGPLCEFLGKPVPDVPFPCGNKGSGEFQHNMEEATSDVVKNALRNMALTTIVIGVSIAVLWRF